MSRVVFLVLPGVQVVDLAGPVQVFHQANLDGAGYETEFVGVSGEAESAQGLFLSRLGELDAVAPGKADTVFVPGTDESRLAPGDLAYLGEAALPWLRRAHEAGARLCAVCTGAFVLAEAGLLDDRCCTTHWACLETFRARYPRVGMVGASIFTRSGSIYMSAGVATEIDLALSLVEEDHGPLVASQVARALVVYLRRSGAHAQESVYLDFRTHDNPAVHRAQSWIVNHPGRAGTLDELARCVGMSARNLSRQFKKSTGLTVKQFADRVRLDLARHLMFDPGMTVEAIGRECGYKDARQFRRVWKVVHGAPPTSTRWRSSERA